MEISFGQFGGGLLRQTGGVALQSPG